MNKRGISDLVTAILIILLVLGAVAIVWYVVRPMIGESAGQITTGAVTTDLTIIGVDATADVVTVKRNTGAGNLVGVKFVLTKSGEFIDGTCVSIGCSGDEDCEEEGCELVCIRTSKCEGKTQIDCESDSDCI